MTSSEQLNQYESARRSKNTPAVKSPCFGYSIVELSAAAEWLLSGWSWQNIVCLYVKIWTIKKVNQERLMNANSHTSGNKSLVPVLSLSLSSAANMMSGVGSGSGVQVIDSPLLTQQIEAQRLCIKHLKNENNRLKVQVTSKPPQLLEFTIFFMMNLQRREEIVTRVKKRREVNLKAANISS